MRALWSDRPNCSHNVSQKVKRIRRFSVPLAHSFTFRTRVASGFVQRQLTLAQQLLSSKPGAGRLACAACATILSHGHQPWLQLARRYPVLCHSSRYYSLRGLKSGRLSDVSEEGYISEGFQESQTVRDAPEMFEV